MRLTPYIDPNTKALLLNTMYIAPYYEYDNNGKRKKIANDFLYLVYRDITTGEKKLMQIEDPQVDTFITKPEYRKSFPTQRRYMDEHMVNRYSVPYSRLTNFIKNVITEDGVDTNLLPIIAKAPKECFKWRHSYFADYNICDYAMMSYLLNDPYYAEHGMLEKIYFSKAFLDIESDVYGLTTSEIDNGGGPINAISVVIDSDKFGVRYDHPKVYTFLLRDHSRYKEQPFFEENINVFIEECHKEFDEKYNEPEFIIKLFDYEKDLLKETFRMLHSKSPDFIMIWNMSYDIPKIISRLIYLGENPTYYFCHKDFKRHMLQYNYDAIFKNDFKNKNESVDCTSYSMYVDQMLNYAGIRKAKSDYGGVSLDNIAHIELGAEKRRYSSPDVTVLNGAIREYWNFVKYSINDVLLQYGIDMKTEDMMTLFEQSIYGCTRISKTLKQSVYLKNVFAFEYFNYEIVPGNNTNVDYLSNKNEEILNDIDLYHQIKPENSDEEEMIDYDEGLSLKGAVVGNPLLNEAEGVKLYGKKSKFLYKYGIDFDYTAQYPNAKITMNAAPHTQEGRIIIPNQILKNENPDNDPLFMRGGKFIEDYETCRPSALGAWLKLPNYTEIIKSFGDHLEGKLRVDSEGHLIISKSKISRGEYK